MSTRPGVHHPRVRFIVPALLLMAAFVPTSVLLSSQTANADQPPHAPAGLTVDDDAAPLAVEGVPQFGWQVVDPRRGEVQTAYQLLVSRAPTTDPSSATVVWTSGMVRSSQQSYVDVPGLNLAPDHRYYWTVRTWDRAGKPGPFATPAHFDVGLRDADWHALWIRRPGATAEQYEDFSLIRKEVVVGASPVVRARVYASAGQQYDLRVNGVRMAHGPSFSYPSEQYYETTDVTKVIVAGKANVFGFLTHWSTPGQGRPASVPALIARITIDHADGTRQVVTTDATWRTHVGPIVSGPIRNSEGDFVEHVDGRADPVGWDRPGFDDKGWLGAQVLGPHPVAPFLHLVAERSHIVEQRVEPRTLTHMSDGSYVADFGAVIAATPVVNFHVGVAGRAVKVIGGYLLDPDGHVSTTRGVQQTDMHWDYTERAGAQQFRPFDYLAYRYLEVVGAKEPLSKSDVVAYARHASMPNENAATFHTSNPAIDAVWNLARHSALYDTQEQVLDTPTREKGAFMNALGDSRAGMFAFGERAVTYESLKDFAWSQARYWPDGRVNVVYPNGDGGRDIPDSTESFVEWVWRVYMTTGDRDQLASLYPIVRNISAYVARAIDPHTSLVTNLPGGGGDYLGGIVDWPPNMRYGYDVATAARTTENVLTVDVFRHVGEIADALGRPPSEARQQRALAQRVAAAIAQRLTRPDGVLIDGLEADGRPSTHASQHANAFALEYGLVPPTQVKAVSNYVVSLGNAMGVNDFSDLLYGLHATGRDDALVTSITDPKRPGYAQILAEGATFTWESWDARQTGDSESHGFGAGVLPVLQEDILGVRISAPGAAQVDIRTPAIQMRAEGSAATQRGPIAISWRRGPNGRFSLEIMIPANVVATVHIPAAASAIRDGTRSVHGDPGVAAIRASNGETVLTVGSGHYAFSASG
jgi:alpha-L-rhamnosidase